VRLRVEYETNLNLDRDWTMNNYPYPVPAVGQKTQESKALEYEITRFLGDCVRVRIQVGQVVYVIALMVRGEPSCGEIESSRR
jgi:hypothetical protein